MSFINRLAHFSIVISRYPVSHIICIFILFIVISSPICGKQSCLADGMLNRYGISSLLHYSSIYPDPITTATPRRIQPQQPTKKPTKDVVIATTDAALISIIHFNNDQMRLGASFNSIMTPQAALILIIYFRNDPLRRGASFMPLQDAPVTSQVAPISIEDINNNSLGGCASFDFTLISIIHFNNDPMRRGVSFSSIMPPQDTSVSIVVTPQDAPIFDCLTADGGECDSVSDSVAAPTVISFVRGDDKNSTAVELFMEMIAQDAHIRIGCQDYIVSIIPNTVESFLCGSSLVAQVARTHFDEIIYRRAASSIALSTHTHFDDNIYPCGALSGLAVTTVSMAPFTRAHFRATSSVAPHILFGEHYAAFKSYGNIHAQGSPVASSLYSCVIIIIKRLFIVC